MKELLEVFVITFSVILIVIVSLVGVVATIQYNSCQDYSNMGVDAQYHFWTGCMANHPTFGWMPVDEYFNTLNLNAP